MSNPPTNGGDNILCRRTFDEPIGTRRKTPVDATLVESRQRQFLDNDLHRDDSRYGGGGGFGFFPAWVGRGFCRACRGMPRGAGEHRWFPSRGGAQGGQTPPCN